MERPVSEYYERAVAAANGAAPRDVANWMSGELFRLLKDSGEELGEVETRFPPEFVGQVQALLAAGTITRTSAKEVFDASFRTGQAPATVVGERGLAQIGAGDALSGFARDAIANNPKAVGEYRAGKVAAIKFLVGQVMKASKGQANPQAVQEALEAELGDENKEQ